MSPPPLTPSICSLHSLTFQDIKTDATQLVNVRVVDLGHEAHFGRGHRVILGQEQLQLENAA